MNKQSQTLETLIPLAERAYTQAIEAREAALDACARAGIYLDKAKQAEAEAKKVLDLLNQWNDKESHDEDPSTTD